MAESTLSETYDTIRRAVARKYGSSRTPADWSSEETTDIADFIRAGLLRFYNSYEWSFLTIDLAIPLYAPYSTGTVTIVDGAVTGSGTTFPSWAADGDLIVGGIAHAVSARGGDTSLTLADATLDASAGSSYELVQSRYTLPDNYGGLVGTHLGYRAGDSFWPNRLRITTPERIRDMRFYFDTVSDKPRWCAPRAKSSDQSTGQRFEMVFWPPSSESSRVIGRYRVNPDMLAASTNIYPFGGMAHGGTMIAACFAEMQIQLPDFGDVDYEARYADALQRSIQRDKEMSHAPTIGFDRGISTAFGSDWELEDEIAPLRGLPDLDV